MTSLPLPPRQENQTVFKRSSWTICGCTPIHTRTLHRTSRAGVGIDIPKHLGLCLDPRLGSSSWPRCPVRVFLFHSIILSPGHRHSRSCHLVAITLPQVVSERSPTAQLLSAKEKIPKRPNSPLSSCAGGTLSTLTLSRPGYSKPPVSYSPQWLGFKDMAYGACDKHCQLNRNMGHPQGLKLQVWLFLEGDGLQLGIRLANKGLTR